MRTYARNDITGKVIKTDVPNKLYDDGWDRIYAKKSSKEWLLSMPEIMLDEATGWDDGVTLDTPIKFSDFSERLSRSKTTNIKYMIDCGEKCQTPQECGGNGFCFLKKDIE